jgi:hypothetical protein
VTQPIDVSDESTDAPEDVPPPTNKPVLLPASPLMASALQTWFLNLHRPNDLENSVVIAKTVAGKQLVATGIEWEPGGPFYIIVDA